MGWGLCQTHLLLLNVFNKYCGISHINFDLCFVMDYISGIHVCTYLLFIHHNWCTNGYCNAESNIGMHVCHCILWFRMAKLGPNLLSIWFIIINCDYLFILQKQFVYFIYYISWIPHFWLDEKVIKGNISARKLLSICIK